MVMNQWNSLLPKVMEAKLLNEFQEIDIFLDAKGKKEYGRELEHGTDIILLT